MIICDAPTYPGRFRPSAPEADVRQIEMDADGMRVDLLEEMIAKLEGRGPANRSSSTRFPLFRIRAG